MTGRRAWNVRRDCHTHAMDRTSQTTTAPDGRTLMFAEWGYPDGKPIFALHGTPGSRLSRHPNEELVRSTGARVITYDRAGYGGSERHPGRQVADCVGDVASIADALRIERFGVWGGSGGGPHALAVAALLNERVTRAMSVVGVAPYEALGDDWTKGMDPENVKEFGWALEGEETLVPELRQEFARMVERASKNPAELLGDFEVSEADRTVLADEEHSKVRFEAVKEGCRHDVWGWADDDLAFTKSWGFDPAEIKVPVQIWYGTSDVFVPASHGEWLAARIPGAAVRLNNLGHFGNPDDDLIERHAWLLSED